MADTVRRAREDPSITAHDHRFSRRRFVQLAGAGGAALLFPSPAPARSSSARAPLKRGADGVVLRWNAAVLQGVRDSRLGPPMAPRALPIVHTCLYDARGVYHRAPPGTQPGPPLNGAPAQRSPPNEDPA